MCIRDRATFDQGPQRRRTQDARVRRQEMDDDEHQAQQMQNAIERQIRLVIRREQFEQRDRKQLSQQRDWLSQRHQKTEDQEAVSYTHLDVYKRQGHI